MLYIYSQEMLAIPEGVKIHIRSRLVTVEGPRGNSYSVPPVCQSILVYMRDHGCGNIASLVLIHDTYREIDERSFTSRSLLLASFVKRSLDRNPPRLAQECRNSSNSQDSHQQSHHWCYSGLQIQDAICLRPFPHQRQYRKKQRYRAVRG